MTFVSAEADLCTACAPSALFTFSYDDVKSIEYFGDKLPSYWNKDGKTIVRAIEEAYADYDCLTKKAKEFSDKLFLDATRAGGESTLKSASLHTVRLSPLTRLRLTTTARFSSYPRNASPTDAPLLLT